MVDQYIAEKTGIEPAIVQAIREGLQEKAVEYFDTVVGSIELNARATLAARFVVQTEGGGVSFLRAKFEACWKMICQDESGPEPTETDA